MTYYHLYSVSVFFILIELKVTVTLQPCLSGAESHLFPSSHRHRLSEILSIPDIKGNCVIGKM